MEKIQPKEFLDFDNHGHYDQSHRSVQFCILPSPSSVQSQSSPNPVLVLVLNRLSVESILILHIIGWFGTNEAKTVQGDSGGIRIQERICQGYHWYYEGSAGTNNKEVSNR